MTEWTFKVLTAILAAAAGLLGGYDDLLRVLLLAMVIDTAVGTARAFKEHRLSAEVAYYGGFKKLGMLAAIALAVSLDKLVSGDTDHQVLRTLTAGYYVGVLGLSVVENLSSLGVKLPDALVSALERFYEQGQKSQE